MYFGCTCLIKRGGDKGRGKGREHTGKTQVFTLLDILAL